MTEDGRNDAETNGSTDGEVRDRPAVYTIREAADLLRISVNTAKRLARQGQLPGAQKIGQAWRVESRQLHDYLERPYDPRPRTPAGRVIEPRPAGARSTLRP